MSEYAEMSKTGFSETLVLLQTKPNQAGESYVVTGTLVDSNGQELTLRRAVSPVIHDNSTIIFQQHMIPSLLIDERYMDDVITVISKDHLTFHTMFRLEDPHPLCEEYRRFWAAAEEVVAASFAAEAAPDEFPVPEDPGTLPPQD